ncbi:choice-of-anchor A family protein [Aquimarina pacifica]|uniref:choice-of-anchor A family protein n=1 Tax=Aquimarina pacifica TaxID=1296415 RepID=UPI0004727ACF|nr:choice-of-anchor A family protein [Aquimarina pacifica]
MSEIILKFLSLNKNKSGARISSSLLGLSMAIIVLISSSFSGDISSNNVETLSENENCENPLTEALGYNAFVRYGVSVASGDTEGPLAMGGDLTLNGTFTIAAQTGGSFYHNGESQAASLVVNGKVIYKNGQGTHLNQGYAKIGDLTGSTVFDIDNNGARSNTRITPGDFNQSPRIQLQRNQAATSVAHGDIIDFDSAFAKLTSISLAYSTRTANVVIENGSKITLANNTTNVLNLTGNELNSLQNFTFNNQPTSTSPLIINVDHSGDFVWDVKNQAGIGDQHGAFIIFNFYNSSTITINGGGTIIGSVLAPQTDIVKNSSGNINGQVIANTYDHVNGELHQHTYNHCEVPTCELVADAGGNAEFCENNQTTLTASASGSSCSAEEISYSWSGPGIVGSANTKTIVVNQPGTYTVVVTDCSDCTAEDTVTVKENKNPEVEIESEDISCTNNDGGYIDFYFENTAGRSRIELSINGGQSYVNVKDNTGSYSFENLDAGTYDIAIRWGNDECPVTLDPVIIEEIQTITVDAGSDKEICEGEEVTLSASTSAVIEGTCPNGFQYLWSTGETTASIVVSPTEDTEYTVEITGCGTCIAEDTVTVTVLNAPEVEVYSEDVTCAYPNDGFIEFAYDDNSDRSTIDLSIDGGVTFVSVNDNTGFYAFENLTAGTYEIAVRWGNGDCPIALDAVIIEENQTITVNAGTDQEVCIGGEVTLSASTSAVIEGTCPNGFQYLWSTGETTASIVVSPTEDTEYTVEITGCGNCTAQDTVTVTVIDAPEVEVYTEDVTCAYPNDGFIEFAYDDNSDRSTIDLSIDGGVTFVTVNDNTGFYAFENLTAGTYETAVRWSNGDCTIYLDDVVIEETQTITVNAGADKEICEGNEVTLSASTSAIIEGTCPNGFQYIWSTGETTASIVVSPTEDTEYTVSITGCGNCIAEDTVTVTVLDTPEAQVTATDTTCEQDNGTITFTFENDENRTTIDLSIDGGINYTTVDDTIGSYTFDGLDAGTYDIAIRWENEECVVALEDITIIEGEDISVDAGADEVICLGEEVTLSATVEGEGACEECVEYALLDTDYCRGDHNFVVYVNDLGVRMWFSNVDLVWKENEDGTATLKGTVFEYHTTNTYFTVDATYSGRTTTPPVDSPKESFCQSENPSGWVYYTALTGSVTQINGSLNYVISRRGPAFQIGNGANVYESGDAVNGGSGWFNLEGAPTSFGDFNINLGECITTETNGFEYLWSTGETTESITVAPTEDTTYSVTVTNCADCVTEDTVTVTVTEIEVDAGDDITIIEGESGILTASPYIENMSYLWSTGETTASIQVTPTETTTYTVIGTNINGCSSEDSVTVTVEEKDPCLSEQYNLVAYPIPVDAKGILNIDLAVDKDQEITYVTYKMDGNRIGGIITTNIPKGCNTIDLNLLTHCSFAANTQYILVVTGEGWEESINFITLP